MIKVQKIILLIVGVIAIAILAVSLFFYPRHTYQNQEYKDVADISDWKTYRNEEYGFELKYPGDWKRCTDNKAKEFLRITISDASCDTSLYEPLPDFIIISEGSDLKQSSLQSFHDALEEAKLSPDKMFRVPPDNIGLFEVGKIESIEFNGIPALIVEELSPTGDGQISAIYLMHDSGLLEIGYSSNSNKKEFFNILSTFKFIEN